MVYTRYFLVCRVGCAHYKELSELRKLRKHFPDLWKKLQDLDKKTRTDFKSGYSVEKLEERFAKEEKLAEILKNQRGRWREYGYSKFF